VDLSPCMFSRGREPLTTYCDDIQGDYLMRCWSSRSHALVRRVEHCSRKHCSTERHWGQLEGSGCRNWRGGWRARSSRAGQAVAPLSSEGCAAIWIRSKSFYGHFYQKVKVRYAAGSCFLDKVRDGEIGRSRKRLLSGVRGRQKITKKYFCDLISLS